MRPDSVRRLDQNPTIPMQIQIAVNVLWNEVKLGPINLGLRTLNLGRQTGLFGTGSHLGSGWEA